jgi:hypothetical protein
MTRPREWCTRCGEATEHYYTNNARQRTLVARCKPCTNEANRRWYRRNVKRRSAKIEAYRKTLPVAVIREWARRNYAKHIAKRRKKTREYMRRWRAKHRKENNARQRLWCLRNPEKVRAYMRQWRLRQKRAKAAG